jgi:integrase
MPRRLPLYCCEDQDRHGNFRIYFRRKGQPKVRLHGTPWTPAFMEQYERALTGKAVVAEKPHQRRGKPGTWRWLCQEYFASVEFKTLEPETQKVRRRILEETFGEPVAPGRPETFADFPLTKMDRRAVKVLRDRKAKTPEAANARVKAVRRVFEYGLEEHDLDANPARGIRKLPSHSNGHAKWTEEEVRRFMAVHPPGSKARRALFLLLYTGVRRSDVVRLGRQMVKNGWLNLQPRKTQHSSGAVVEIPILPQLQEELDRMPADHLTFLVTDHGRPFTSGGFYNKFKEWCREAGLGHCVPHGLRKAGATLAAENGATPHELMAIFGWTSTQMAELYTRQANKRKLAANAMPLLHL